MIPNTDMHVCRTVLYIKQLVEIATSTPTTDVIGYRPTNA